MVAWDQVTFNVNEIPNPNKTHKTQQKSGTATACRIKHNQTVVCRMDKGGGGQQQTGKSIGRGVESRMDGEEGGGTQNSASGVMTSVSTLCRRHLLPHHHRLRICPEE